jgi:hypothetical protein
MSTYALVALPDDRALTAQADRLRSAHASLVATLAQPVFATSSVSENQTQELRSLEQELTAVEGMFGVASALARAAERTARDAARFVGLRPLWLERYALEETEETEAALKNTTYANTERRGRTA